MMPCDYCNEPSTGQIGRFYHCDDHEGAAGLANLRDAARAAALTEWDRSMHRLDRHLNGTKLERFKMRWSRRARAFLSGLRSQFRSF